MFDCASIDATLVEKVISMLRRTMSVKRNAQRKDDATLVQHIYDVYCILKIEEQTDLLDLKTLTPLFKKVLEEDVERFGNQHAEFVSSPKQELELGLKELGENPVFRQHFQDFVTPMVFNSEPHDFDICFVSFKRVAEPLIKTI